jgi:thiosulfate/3-mercaptopyruvate sulfurtransferase
VSSELPPVVDAGWLAAHLGEEDILLADVRGPNAHARGHIAGSIPLMVGTPGQFTSPDVRDAFAAEASLRLRRHGVTGEERLVLYDGGDCVSAASALQVAELGGHRRVAVLAGGLAGWQGELETGVVEVEKTRAQLEPRPDTVAALWELRDREADPPLLFLDVRREDEFSGKGGYPCDPRQGHIPGARNVEVSTLFAAPGVPKPAEAVRALVGDDADGKRVVTYCHSGSRSGLALIALRAAGYEAKNYFGSWHEWSRHDELPLER